jgi:hypothetical protein
MNVWVINTFHTNKFSLFQTFTESISYNWYFINFSDILLCCEIWEIRYNQNYIQTNDTFTENSSQAHNPTVSHVASESC